MPFKKSPPVATVRRLSMYLQCLNFLAKDGETLCSSHLLAKLLHINPAQVRKDLAYFGEFGKRGVGYSVNKLREHIVRILGLKVLRPIGIVGAGGRLGQALAKYQGFEKRNFKVIALFDKDPVVIKRSPEGIGKIHHIEKLPTIVKDLGIELIIITVPVEAVMEVFEIVRLSSVKAILNFAPMKLRSTPELVVHNADLVTELESLSYYLTNNPVAFGDDPPPFSEE